MTQPITNHAADAAEREFAEQRRPGIVAIFDRLAKERPKMRFEDRAALAKREWYEKIYWPNKAAINAGTYFPQTSQRVTS